MFIHGNNLEEISGDITQKMEDCSKIVGEIAKKLGIRISPLYRLYPRNIMQEDKTGRLVLIDFEAWEYFDFS